MIVAIGNKIIQTTEWIMNNNKRFRLETTLNDKKRSKNKNSKCNSIQILIGQMSNVKC